ncbi:MAG: AI-2E family transporter [Alkalimonas sp.]|nr:AI-2E family transporter [Alkalimonas sp.]
MSETPETPLFGTVERRLFRVTAILFVLIAFAGLIGVLVWGLVFVLSFFFNLILPLAVAGILALILYPVVDYLEHRARMSRIFATSLIVLLFILLISGAMLFLIPAMYREVMYFIMAIPGFIEGSESYMISRFPKITRMLMERMEDGSMEKLLPAIENTGKTITAYAGAVLVLTIVPILLFFALLSGDRLRAQAKGIASVFSAKTQRKIMYFIDVFVGQVLGFFQGQLVIAVLMGVMLAIGFTVIGLKGAIFIGLVLGLLNIVPFLGILIGLLVVMPLAYFQTEGGLQLLGLSLLVFVIVQLVESWLLTPKIMANRSGLHPALVVISVMFWGIALDGVIGMILAVPLTAFFIAVWRQAKVSLTRSMENDE